MSSAREEFLEELFALHFKALLRYGSSLTGYDSRFYPCVEECVQEVFVAAFQDYERLKKHPNAAGWLRVTLEHRIRHRMRKERFEMNRVLSWDAVAHQADVSDEEDGIETFLHNEENQQKVKYALSKLTAKEQNIMVEYYLEGKSVNEMAHIHHTSQGVIRVQLHRIRQRIKNILENAAFLLTLLF